MRRFRMTSMCRTAAMAIAMAVIPSQAHADIDLFEKDGWGFRTTGMVQAHYQMMMGEGDLALDFLHVWVETPNRIALERNGEEIIGTIELLPGDELSLSIAPYRDITRLLGSGSADWASSSSAVDVLQDGNPRRRRLVARQPGTTTITASCFDLEATINLVVLP